MRNITPRYTAYDHKAGKVSQQTEKNSRVKEQHNVPTTYPTNHPSNHHLTSQ